MIIIIIINNNSGDLAQKMRTEQECRAEEEEKHNLVLANTYQVIPK